jgi:hypothetical protein
MLKADIPLCFEEGHTERFPVLESIHGILNREKDSKVGIIVKVSCCPDSFQYQGPVD